MTNAENIGSPAAKAVKKKASGSSFYIAMRLMPAEQRDAMFAIYAFCRKVDDIADDGIGTRAERHEKLEQWRVDLRGLYAGAIAPQVRFLAPVPAGARVRLRIVLTGVEPRDGGQVVMKTLNTMEVEGSEKPALIAETLALLIPAKRESRP